MSVARPKSGRERNQYSAQNLSRVSSRNTRVSGVSRSTSGRVSLPPLYISGYPSGSYPKGLSTQFLSIPTRSVSPVSALDEDASVYSEYVSETEEKAGGHSTRAALKGRISTVSQYPVFSSRPTSVENRGKLMGRPISIASTSSAGIFLAVGQLPGSELFELASPTATKYPLSTPSLPKAKGRRADTTGIKDATVYDTAQTVRLQRVGSHSSKHTLGNRISIVSTVSQRESSPQRNQTILANSGKPSPPALQEPNTTNAQALIDGLGISGVSTYPPMVTVNGRVSRLPPPPPPPKDPGYVNRRPALNIGRERYVGATETVYPPRKSSRRQGQAASEQRQRSDSRQRNTQKGFWKAFKGPRVGLPAYNSSNNSKMRAKARMRARKHQETRAESGSSPSKLLGACARFFQRALPRLNFRKDSHSY
jgi:hypothetical protein